MRRTLLLLFGLTTLYRIQAQPQRQRGRSGQQSRPAFSFQSFDHSTGFPGESSLLSSSDIPSPLAAHLTSSTGGVPAASADFQEQPARGNELHDSVANLPLYKQSFPGVYVKGHAADVLNKYEPTRQVAHHHGPNYQIPRNIASSPEHDFAGEVFPTFN